MDKKIEKQIVFSLLIIVIVLFSVSQLFPWANITYDDKNFVTFYSWGTSEGGISGIQTAPFYLTGFFETIDSVQYIPAESSEQIDVTKTLAIGNLFLFVAWILSILSISITIIAFQRLYNFKEQKMKDWIFTSSFASITMLFMFYISISFFIMEPIKNLSLSSSSTFSNYFSVFSLSLPTLKLSWSVGFFLFLLGTILIGSICIFFISKKFSERMEINEKSTEVKKKDNKNE